MLISTEIASSSRLLGEEKAIEAIAKAGFDAWDFSTYTHCRLNWDTGEALLLPHPFNSPNYLAFARRLKQIGLDNGIHCNQSHAPFPCRHPVLHSYVKRAIECTAEAGGSICVIHPDNGSSPERNAEMFAELLPFAREHGVKIAAENMRTWSDEKDEATPAACYNPENFLKHLELVNDDNLVACLDIGHAEMRGLNTSAEELILALGDHLQALHIHDNDLHHDSHQLPFTMKIDFEKVTSALRRIGYKGYVTLEADAYIESRGDENAEAGLREMARAARRIAAMIEGK